MAEVTTRKLAARRVQPRRSRSGWRLAAQQVYYQGVLMGRSPLPTFIALVLPLVLLFALNVVSPASKSMVSGSSYAQFLTGAMCFFAVINACYVNTITGIVTARDTGVLKRLRGTPLPAWSYLAGRFAIGALTAAAGAAVVVALAVALFDVTLHGANAWAIVLSIAVAIVCLSAVGVAVASFVRRTDAALAIAFGTMLPLAFISGVFFPSSYGPQWLRALANAFPLRPLAGSIEFAFDPHHTGSPFSGYRIGVIAAWTAVAVIVALMHFRWDPHADSAAWRPWWRRRRH